MADEPIRIVYDKNNGSFPWKAVQGTRYVAGHQSLEDALDSYPTATIAKSTIDRHIARLRAAVRGRISGN